MKANELRIGNWINEYGISRKVIPLDIVYLSQFEQAEKICIELTPISLTEEWLLKFGFKYQDRDVNRTNNRTERFYISPHFGEHREYWIDLQLETNALKVPFAWLNWDIGGGHDHIHLPEGHKLQYIHQLQNLYFALTGEELNIKD